MTNTVFPGIEIDVVETGNYKASNDPNQKQLTTAYRSVDKITPDMVQERFEGHRELNYVLSIRAATETGARMKARSYVRAKNFFEPSMVKVYLVENVKLGGALNKYNVTVGVKK